MNKNIKPVLPRGIYGITSEKHSNGRRNTDVVREMIKGGVSIVQYREKDDKSIREKYLECKEIRKMTRDAGVLFIVNDYIDIALLTEADGIHIGQDDLPVSEVRKITGDMIIGVSTHSSGQAGTAIEEGADYIGVGPIFKTNTKINVCNPVGLEYLDYAVKNIKIPFVAIGGIKKSNIDEVIGRGAKTIALVTEIVSSEDIAGTVRLLKDKMVSASILPA